jgi:hypothetical protein
LRLLEIAREGSGNLLMSPTQPIPVLTSALRTPADWKAATGVLLLVAVMMAVLLPAGGAWADDADSSGGSDERGITVAAWALTVPYIIAKGAFAAGGAVVGALGYLFSGLDDRTAKAVWTRSIYGTYIIRPAHLRGEEAVRFLGEEHEPQNEPMPAADQAPPQPVVPEKK